MSSKWADAKKKSPDFEFVTRAWAHPFDGTPRVLRPKAPRRRSESEVAALQERCSSGSRALRAERVGASAVRESSVAILAADGCVLGTAAPSAGCVYDRTEELNGTDHQRDRDQRHRQKPSHSGPPLWNRLTRLYAPGRRREETTDSRWSPAAFSIPVLFSAPSNPSAQREPYRWGWEALPTRPSPTRDCPAACRAARRSHP